MLELHNTAGASCQEPGPGMNHGNIAAHATCKRNVSMSGLVVRELRSPLGLLQQPFLLLQDVKAQLAKAAWMEQQQPAAGSAGAGSAGAGSSSAAAAAGTQGGRRAAAAAAGGGGGLGIRADDMRRLMDL
jgi:hypothetical protein